MYQINSTQTDAENLIENKKKLDTLNEKHSILYRDLTNEDNIAYKDIIQKEFDKVTYEIKVTEQLIIYYECRTSVF